jgi:periplasmic mercuric ion binding protein
MRMFLLAGLLAIATAATAQMPKVQKAVIKTPTATCEECKTIIEKIAPQYLDGLVKMVVNFKTKQTQVSWYPDRTNIEEIKTAIANAGFDADDVTANEEVYKKLPICCKKVSDGGGPPKKTGSN